MPATNALRPACLQVLSDGNATKCPRRRFRALLEQRLFVGISSRRIGEKCLGRGALGRLLRNMRAETVSDNKNSLEVKI